MRGLGRHEAEHVLQDRVHDRVEPVLGEDLVVVLGLPHVDVAQPGLGAPGQVGDQAGRPRLLIETAISGTDQAVPAGQRDYVRAIQAAPDAATKITIYAAAIAAIAPRMALVLGIIQQAARDEPELAALWAEIAERRAANMRLFVADLAAVAPLRLDPDQAADIVWATNAAEMYQLLVSQRGWSPQHYEDFLADTWRRLLLAD